MKSKCWHVACLVVSALSLLLLLKPACLALCHGCARDAEAVNPKRFFETSSDPKIQAIATPPPTHPTERPRGGLTAKYCVFCYHGTTELMRPEVWFACCREAARVGWAYKTDSTLLHAPCLQNTTLLSKFVSERGQILPKRITKCCAKHQRRYDLHFRRRHRHNTVHLRPPPLTPTTATTVHRPIRLATTIKRSRQLQLMPYSQRQHPRLRATKLKPGPVCWPLHRRLFAPPPPSLPSATTLTLSLATPTHPPHTTVRALTQLCVATGAGSSRRSHETGQGSNLRLGLQ